jgi:phosphoethanolamine N-methyltransferase
MQTHLEESAQYTSRSVHRYEKIFGEDFVSTGGLESTKAICATLSLTPGQSVLDVGSGLGGSAFYMAKNFGVNITGVDILPSMVSEASARADERGVDSVSFINADILEIELPEKSYDLAYSRDALMYIEDKIALFTKIRSLLKPGAALCVTDYGRGPDPLPGDFIEYEKDAGYFLLQPEAYGKVLETVGFTNVEALDKTDEFVAILRSEIDKVNGLSDDPETGIDPEDRAYLVDRWQKKIEWCNAGHMRWVHLRATA